MRSFIAKIGEKKCGKKMNMLTMQAGNGKNLEKVV